MPVKNSHLAGMTNDYLYHLGLSTHDNLKALFSDVKFLVVGGSAIRLELFAERVIEKLGPNGANLIDFPNYLKKVHPIGKTERFSL